MSIIKGYHSQNKAARMFGRKSEYHIGFELEVQSPSYEVDKMDADAKQVRDEFHANNYVYFEWDSTVRPGYEIITAPQTATYIRDHREAWTNVLNDLAAKGYRSHDASCSCGLHVHIEATAFGELESERDFNETKAVLIVERFYQDMARFARRSSTWATPLRNTTPVEVENMVKREKQNGSNHTRAVNVGNRNTVEFRLFKGTLKPDTLFASIELCIAIVSAARNLKLKDIMAAETLREVLTRGCIGRLNATLDNYMLSRGL